MVTRNSIGSNIPIDPSLGGTGSSSFSTTNGIAYFNGTAITGTQYALLDANGCYTNSHNPASAGLTADTNNVTGSGTYYTLLGSSSIPYKNGSYYASGTGTITVPVTGVYRFTASGFTSGGSNNACLIVVKIVTTSLTYYSDFLIDAGNSIGENHMTLTALCKMTAGDTAYASIMVGGDATDTSDVQLGNMETMFSGFLVT
jgi:hypothetical protein